MKYGIDVSYAQAGFDFNQAVADGKQFAIVKIGEHNYMDDSFAENINGALDAGMDVGVYYIPRSLDIESMKADAQYFADMIKQDISAELKCGIWLDIEEQYYEGKVSNQDLTDLVSAFIVVMNQNGFDCGIYASYNMLTYHIDVSQFADYVKYWVAQYNSQNDFKLEHPEKNVVIWQYSESNGQLDVDVMY